jgi:hypothetical protein
MVRGHILCSNLPSNSSCTAFRSSKNRTLSPALFGSILFTTAHIDLCAQPELMMKTEVNKEG